MKSINLKGSTLCNSSKLIKRITSVLFIYSLGLCSITASEFDDFAKKYLASKNKFETSYREDYTAYIDSYREEMQAYKEKLSNTWGFAEVSTEKKAVVYTDSLKEKVVVDFEKNEISVSKLIDSKSTPEQLEAIVVKTLSTPISKLKADSNTSASAPLSKTGEPTVTTAGNANQQSSLTAHIGDKQSSSPTLAQTLAMTNQDVEAIAKNVAYKAKVESEGEALKATISNLEQQKTEVNHSISVESANESAVSEAKYVRQLDQEKRSYQHRLAQIQADPSAVKTQVRKVKINSKRWKRTEPYRTYVTSQAKKNYLPPHLIYAIMETESSFNPLAVSPIPAFGLMQIVPTSAGVDANYQINRRKNPPKKETLFQPSHNVLFGSTYLNILYFKYLRSINDETSRLYCTIAAYNTGAGNVARSFNGKSRSIKKAAIKINNLKPEQVYSHLILNLPYEETRNYLRKVRSAMSYYHHQVKSSSLSHKT